MFDGSDAQQLLQQFSLYNGEDACFNSGFDTGNTHTLAIKLYDQIPNHSTLLLNPQTSYQFIAGFLAAIAKNCRIFLANSRWQQQEWEAVLALVQPEVIINENEVEYLWTSAGDSGERHTQQTIMIPTGGSSGKIRFVKHNWETLTASVTGFCHYFQQQRVNCFCVLPLYHVSGLMQLMRALLTGGNLILYSYKTLERAWQQQDWKTIAFLETWHQQDYLISLVPTQLQRLLNFGAGNWLSQFQTVLLGGAPPWDSLLATAREYQIPISLTYGMTETASQIVTLQPDDFLAGNNSVGKVLPHAQVWITGKQGEELPQGKVGKVTVKSQSLGFSYYGNSDWNRDAFLTDDLGYFDQDNYLYIVGRNTRKIITGGENVFPNEVENAILSTEMVSDVYVMGAPDKQWGEVVSAIYVPKQEAVQVSDIEKPLKDHLSHYKIPKQWQRVSSIPRNEQGKINLAWIKENVVEWD